MNIPKTLRHKPVFAADYEEIDSQANAGDARFLSIGRSTWNNNVFSVKVWRTLDNGAWARGSEDLPMWRLLDMAIILVSQINGKKCYLNQECVEQNDLTKLKHFLSENEPLLKPRIEELKRILK